MLDWLTVAEIARFQGGTPGKLVGSACYDTQQVCVYLQPFSR